MNRRVQIFISRPSGSPQHGYSPSLRLVTRFKIVIGGIIFVAFAIAALIVALILSSIVAALVCIALVIATTALILKAAVRRSQRQNSASRFPVSIESEDLLKRLDK